MHLLRLRSMSECNPRYAVATTGSNTRSRWREQLERLRLHLAEFSDTHRGVSGRRSGLDAIFHTVAVVECS